MQETLLKLKHFDFKKSIWMSQDFKGETETPINKVGEHEKPRKDSSKKNILDKMQKSHG